MHNEFLRIFIMQGDEMTILTYNFSAIRGKQFGKNFYSFMCPLSILSRLFNENNKNIPQIILDKIVVNNDLVESITNKILNNKTTYFVEPILAVINTSIDFKVLENQYAEIGIISFSMHGDCLIVNGLEEKKALEKAIKKNPKLKNSVISVVIYFDPLFVLAEKLFDDKVMNGDYKDNKKIDKIELYIDQLIEKHDFIKNRIDMNNKSLGKYSKKLYLKKQIIKTTRILLGEKSIEEMREMIDSFWIDYFTQIELIKQFDGYKIRTNYVINYGTVLEAMAFSVKELYDNDEYDSEKFFRNINGMDWARKNYDWKKNILTDSGRVIKNNEVIMYVTNMISNKYRKTLA